MRWLKISNSGCFDVVAAVNMMGASVKVGENPIGMFGSGTKYALAQAVRGDIPVKIWNGEHMFNVGTKTKTFRDRAFKMVTLKQVGTHHVTPITTELGSKDWNDDWFIFREFYSNARDEKNGRMEIVDDVVGEADNTSVFLPFEKFSTYFNNIEDYFTTKKPGEVWVGKAGRVYRQSVYVGEIKGTTLCINSPSVKINECRVADNDSSLSYLAHYINWSGNTDIYAALLTSSEDVIKNVDICFSERQYGHLHEALVRVYGENYCVCPEVDFVIKDVEGLGMVPVVLPTSWNVKSDKINNYLSLAGNKIVRPMNDEEQKKYTTARSKISAFIPIDLELKVEVFNESTGLFLGDAKLGSNEIRIAEKMFDNEEELLHVLIHEIGHIITKADDYSRKFTAFFVDCLVKLAK